ncbi:Fanconi anemia group C protein-like [Glandiceps talaboti]
MAEQIGEQSSEESYDCTSQVGAEVTDWLKRAKLWDQEDTGRSARETYENIPNLRSFLHRLHDLLSTWQDTSHTVNVLPNVGQLLGRLCGNKSVLLSESTCNILLKCILALAPNEPKNQLEERAKQWAHSQVKHVAGYRPTENPFRTDMMAYSPDEFNQIALDKLIGAIQADLESQCLRKWNSGTNCLVPVRCHLSNHKDLTVGNNIHRNFSGNPDGASGNIDGSLTEISNMCLPLINMPQTLTLIESLLSCHSASTLEELSPTFLNTVTELQNDCYSKENCVLKLSYRGRVQLWLRHLPALQQEVYNLVKVTVVQKPWISRKYVMSVIKSRNLPTACVENPAIYHAVNAILKSIYVSCHGNCLVLRLISVFLLSLIDAVSSDVTEPHIQLGSFFPRTLQPLVHLLAIQPQGLSNSGCYHQLQCMNTLIRQLLSTSNNLGGTDLCWILVQFNLWFYKAVELALYPDTDLEVTLTFLSWYFLPLSPEELELQKNSLREIIMAFRVLQSKVYLQSCDLQYALSANQTSHSNQVTHIITSLLVLFLVKSSGGHLIAMEIIDLFPYVSTDDRLATLLELIEIFLEFSGSIQIAQLGSAKVQAIIDVVIKLKDSYQSEILVSKNIAKEIYRQAHTDQLIRRCDEVIASLQRS